MTADKPSPFVPKLRFPEFRDAPDWEKVSLSTLLVRAPDYGVNAAAVPFSETLPTYIRITDINDDGQFASRARVSVDIDATDEQYLEDGDIVLARTGASVGKSYRYREEDGRLVYAGFLIRVRPNPERLLSQFLAAYLSTWSYWDWVRLTSARSGQPGINATEYASIPLPLPPDRRTLAEQQKIADCLGSLDDLIAAEGRMLEALRQHKQGLMQQLFPQPGETVPRLRFLEFRDAAEWKTKILGTQGSFLSSLTGKAAKDFDTGDAAFIPYMNVFSNAFTNTTDLRSVNVADDESQSAVAKGDVFFTVSSETPEEAGLSSVLLEEIGNCYLNSFCALFRFDEGKSPDPVFLGYLLRSATAREHLSRGAQGATRYNISRATFRSLPILIPSGPEQKKTADCLGPLDDLIAAEGRMLDSLRQHKRGLMQQLFPSLEGH